MNRCHDIRWLQLVVWLALILWSDVSLGLTTTRTWSCCRLPSTTIISCNHQRHLQRSTTVSLSARFPFVGGKSRHDEEISQSDDLVSRPSLSSTMDIADGTVVNGSPSYAVDVETDGKLQSTIHALRLQLQRQQEDVEMTQNLLDRLEGRKTHFTPRSEVKDEHLKQLAASLVSGVDYGFESRSEGAKIDDIGGNLGVGPPANLWKLGWNQFFRNLRAMIGEYEDEEDLSLSPEQKELHYRLEQLELNSTAIWEAETKDGPIQAPWVIKAPYLVLCWLLDVLFEGKYVPSRFFLLETVARMPYFSYITMLHLYETLGFYRRSADVKRIHFAEEINEYRHLLIMESLGGDQQFWVRFTAQHSAIVYFFVLCTLWMISPSLSYKFSELLETHAVNTYGQFLKENEEELRTLPPTLAAIEYYSFGAADPFYGEFQTASLSKGGEVRKLWLWILILFAARKETIQFNTREFFFSRFEDPEKI